MVPNKIRFPCFICFTKISDSKYKVTFSDLLFNLQHIETFGKSLD